jgi:hypothetical protein
MALLTDLDETEDKYIGYSTLELHADVDLGTIIQTLIDKCNELEGRIETLETP